MLVMQHNQQWRGLKKALRHDVICCCYWCNLTHVFSRFILSTIASFLIHNMSYDAYNLSFLDPHC